MKHFFLLGILTLILVNSNAQNKYPLEISPNKTVKLKSESDKLWVLNNSQYEKYNDIEPRQHKVDSMFSIFQAEVKTLNKVIRLKNDLIKKNKQSSDHFKTKWEEADAMLLAEEEKSSKTKSKNKIWTGVGFISGVTIAFVIQALL